MQHNTSLPNLNALRSRDNADAEAVIQAHRFSQPQMQAHSRESSSHSTTADSSPISSTSSSRGRSSTTNSSLSTTPPYHDPSEPSSASKKSLPALPDVAEDPERETHAYTYPTFTSSIANSPVSLSRQTSREFVWQRPDSFYSNPLDFNSDDFYTAHDEHLAKKRRSGDSTFNGLATRLVERFPSLSRRKSKRTSAPVCDDRSDSTPQFLGRTNSFKRAFATRSLDFLSTAPEPQLMASPIETIVEDDHRDAGQDAVMSYEYVDQDTDLVMSPPLDMSFSELQEEVPEPIIRSSTPLLPPLLRDLPERELIQSPLISPTVAAHSIPPSSTHTPIGTPYVPGSESPTLSTQPSTASFNRSRAATMVSSASEIPPLVIAEDDEWADRLGHANFYIFPEPWQPSKCDLDSCKKLLADWELARNEYAEHLARTKAHFGENSRTYKVTQEKWASIDLEWKRNNEEAARKAAESGATPYHIIPVEPAPLPLSAKLDPARAIAGCDMGIVGPMAQVVPQPQLPTKPSKRAALLKMMGLQMSLGRSTSSP